MGDPQNDSKWDWHQCGSNRKKTWCFSSQIFIFLFEKKCGFVHRKISDEKMKKNDVQKKCPFCARSFWRLLDVHQYYCGMLFRYKCWCPESLGYVRPLYTCHGRPLFQKVPKISPGAYFPRQNVAPCGFNKIFFIGNKFYMHELHSVTRVSRRNSFRPK